MQTSLSVLSEQHSIGAFTVTSCLQVKSTRAGSSVAREGRSGVTKPTAKRQNFVRSNLRVCPQYPSDNSSCNIPSLASAGHSHLAEFCDELHEMLSGVAHSMLCLVATG